MPSAPVLCILFPRIFGDARPSLPLLLQGRMHGLSASFLNLFEIGFVLLKSIDVCIVCTSLCSTDALSVLFLIEFTVFPTLLVHFAVLLRALSNLLMSSMSTFWVTLMSLWMGSPVIERNYGRSRCPSCYVCILILS